MRRDARDNTFSGRSRPRTTTSSAPAAARLPAALRARAVAACRRSRPCTSDTSKTQSSR